MDETRTEATNQRVFGPLLPSAEVSNTLEIPFGRSSVGGGLRLFRWPSWKEMGMWNGFE